MRLVDATIAELVEALRPVIRQEIDAALLERMGPPRQFMSVAQAADELGVNRCVLYDAVKRGQLRGLRVGRQWRFTRSDLERWGESRAG